MASQMIAGRSYVNWVRELCQKNKEDVQVSIDMIHPGELCGRNIFSCKMVVIDSTGNKLHEVSFPAESKQKARQGAALAMVRKLGYTDEMLKDLALKPKANGELPRCVRKAEEAGVKVEEELAPSAPYVQDVMSALMMQDRSVSYPTELKKLCATIGLVKPVYKDTNATGPAHQRAFEIQGFVSGRGAVKDFTAKIHATGKKSEVKNMVACELWEEIVSMKKEILERVLKWGSQSPENKAQLPDGFMDFGQNEVASGVANLDIKDIP